MRAQGGEEIERWEDTGGRGLGSGAAVLMPGIIGNPTGVRVITQALECDRRMDQVPKHELAAVEGWDRFKAAVGGPNSAACDGMDMGMSCEALRNVKQPAFETAKPPPVKPFC